LNSRAKNRVGWALLAAALAVGLLARYVMRPPRSEEAARVRLLGLRPQARNVNVVVVTLDTTRADRLGCYGFKGIKTPNIDRLAAEGVLFEQATAAVPLTFPSHSTMFTGLNPPRHEVHDNGGFFLDASRVTLAERMKEAGYQTGAFVGAWVLDSKWGLNQGFDEYDDKFDLSKYKVLSLGTVQREGDDVMNRALKWMEGAETKGRFFAWIHLYDAHSPYDPPEPYASQYKGQPYIGEIAKLDGIVGRLMTHLETKGLMDNTVIVLTADHGESLGDHGESTHSYFIYDSTTHVPLIIRTPWGFKGRTVAQAAGADLFPTVLDLAGLAPQPDIDGHSLARALMDRSADLAHVAYSETFYPRFHYGWSELRSLRDGRYKFIAAPTPELYDLQQDPLEKDNIYKTFSKRGEDMRVRLERFVGDTATSAPEKKQLDPDTLQRLAALGYVGSTPVIEPGAVLADPKDKIRLYALIHDARDLGQANKLDAAIGKMHEVLAEDPHIVDGYISIGNWELKANRPEKAIEAYAQVLALQPDNEIAMVNLANVYRQRGETEKAVAGYRAALKLDAKSSQTWYQLATLFLDDGRIADAESTFHQALQSNPKMGAAYNSLGAIAWSRGQKQEAEKLIARGLELEPEVRTGRFNLARIVEARGDLAGAERLYRDELATYADNGKARFNLAQLLRERGDREGYLHELLESVDKAPEFGPAFFFLAREELRNGGLAGAQELARRGLEVDPYSEIAPLGHFVLADVYGRQGDAAKARAEALKGQQLEARIRSRPKPVV
jgi:choline-sulfatase